MLFLHMCPQSLHSARKGSCCMGAAGMVMWSLCQGCSRGHGGGLIRGMGMAGRGKGRASVGDLLGKLQGMPHLHLGVQFSRGLEKVYQNHQRTQASQHCGRKLPQLCQV